MRSDARVLTTITSIILLIAVSSNAALACTYEYHGITKPIVILGGIGASGTESSLQAFYDIDYYEGSYYVVGNAFVQTDTYTLKSIAVIVKLDSSFRKEWVSVISGSNYEYASSVTTVPGSEKVYVTGQTTSYGFGASDVFLAVYGTNGVLGKYLCIGSKYIDYGETIRHYNGKLYIIGATNSTLNGKFGVLIIKLDTASLDLEGSYVIEPLDYDTSIMPTGEPGIYNGILVIPAILKTTAIINKSHSYAFIAAVDLRGNKPRLMFNTTYLAAAGNVTSISVYPTNECIYVALSARDDYWDETTIIIFRMSWNGSVDSANTIYMKFNGSAFVTSIRYDESSGKLYVTGLAQNLSGDNTQDLFVAVFDKSFVLEKMYYHELKMNIGGSPVAFNYDSARSRFVNNMLVIPGRANAARLVNGKIVSYAVVAVFDPLLWKPYDKTVSYYRGLIDVTSSINIKLDNTNMSIKVVKPLVKDYTRNYTIRMLGKSNSIRVKALQKNLSTGILILTSNSTLHTNYFGSGYEIVVNTTSVVNDTVTSNGLFIGAILSVKGMVTIFSNTSIKSYYISTRNITVVFSGNALISIAAPKGSIAEIYKNNKLACKGSTCSSMRDSDGVITLEPTTLTIIPASPPPRTSTPRGSAEASCCMGGSLSTPSEALIIVLALAPAIMLVLAILVARRIR